MTKNIGTINAMIRIACGFAILACATARLARNPYRQMYHWYALLGGLKVAEGILRYCPLTALSEKLPEMKKEKEKTTSHSMSQPTADDAEIEAAIKQAVRVD
ncbi:YgaP family membrane protein [Aureibacillus halotolerans]|uniref:DUF2892 family protein n=1 Tax=Aureibacillus halotolerans TaxID=1508390 RepID=A0A4R6TXB4_9BACI|nr:DUF2892 domain-containing protein [Aureibacillus halotolerans]TDQ34155.1 DUF2892 family protein [Aureibacillus halotolerans]